MFGCIDHGGTANGKNRTSWNNSTRARIKRGRYKTRNRIYDLQGTRVLHPPISVSKVDTEIT